MASGPNLVMWVEKSAMKIQKSRIAAPIRKVGLRSSRRTT